MPAKDTVALDDDVELRTVALASPLNRTMVKDALYTEETIETAKGKVLVAFAGDRKKPAILTYHDLGLNYISNFQAREKTSYIYTRNKYPKPSLSTSVYRICGVIRPITDIYRVFHQLADLGLADFDLFDSTWADMGFGQKWLSNWPR